MLTAALSKVASLLLGYVANRAADALRGTPVESAIAATQDAFPEFVVDEALRAWTTSDEFQQLVNSFIGGDRSLNDEQLVQSFLEVGGFYAPDDQEVPAGVVGRFLQELERALYLSPDGPVAIASRNEVLQAATQAKLVAIGEDVTAVRLRLDSDTPVAEGRPAQDAVWHARIDASRELLKQGRPAVVREMLEGLRDDIPESAGDEVWIRLESNLASACLSLDDIPAARAHYTSALRRSPGFSKALTLGAQVELRASNVDRAVELARDAWASEEAPHTGGVLLLALAQAGRTEELDQFVARNSWIEADADGAAVLGQIALDSGRPVAAAHRFRESLAVAPRNNQVRVQLAISLIRGVQEAVSDSVPLPWLMDAAFTDALAEAEQLLTEAAEGFKSEEPRNAHLETVALRASVRGLLRRRSDAVADADYVLHEDPTNYVALRTKGLSLLGDSPAEAASALAEARDQSGEEPAVALALASALERTGDVTGAIAALKSVRDEHSADPMQIEIEAALARVLWQGEARDEAANVEAQIKARWPHDPRAEVALAEVEQSRGDESSALERLRALADTAEGALRDHVGLQLSEMLLNADDHSGAVDALASVVDDKAPLWLRQRYAIALLNSGDERRALDYARAQRELAGSVVAVISEVEAEILLRIADHRGAREVYEALAAQEGRASFWLRAAWLALQQRDVSRAQELVGQVTEQDVANDAYSLVNLAQIRLALKLDQVLPPAYRARRLAYRDASVHLAYVSIFLSRESADDGMLRVSRAAADAVVALERGETKRIVVIDNDEPDAGRNEVPESSPLAQRLIGLAAGDTVTFLEGEVGEHEYAVTEVKSKYVHAFHDTLANFATLFPDNSALQAIDVGDRDFTPIFQLLDRRHAVGTQVLTLYNNRQLPQASVAQLLHAPTLDVSEDLRRTADQPVYVSTGERDELEQAVARSRDVAVLEHTALLSISGLRVWDLAAKTYGRLVVPQFVVEDIRQQAENPLEGKRTGFMGKADGGYVSEDVSPEATTAKRSALEELLAAIDQFCEVVPGSALLDIPKGPRDDMERLIGLGALAAAQAARDVGGVLWADDFALRTLARNEWAVATTWTAAVLALTKRNGDVPEGIYQVALKSMIEWGFWYVLPSAEDLIGMLTEDGASPSPSTTRSLSYSLGPQFSEPYAANLAADVIRGIYMLQILPVRRDLLLDLVMSLFLRGRGSRRSAVDAVLARLSDLVRLFPTSDAILARVKAWR